MKEIRITFRNEDFTAVSRSLVDLGVIFHVEPLEDGYPPAIPDGRTGSTGARPSQTKKRQTKTAIKATPTIQSVPGAGRLREMAERNRAASGEREQQAEAKAHPTGIPEDLSAKLLPYSERQER